LKSVIYGQDEAISAVASAVKSRFLRPDTPKTVAGFLLGTTGTGKTELAKSIARFLYDRPEALANIPMGRIQHESDLNTVFSPGKGIVGADTPGVFETFL